MTATEAAAALGISRQRVSQLIADGRLRATRRPDPATGTLPWDITPRELRRFAALDRRPGRPTQ